MIMTSAVLTCELVKVHDRCHLLEGCHLPLAALVGEILVDIRLRGLLVYTLIWGLRGLQYGILSLNWHLVTSDDD